MLDRKIKLSTALLACVLISLAVPTYAEGKKKRKQVEDDPNLPRVLIIGDSISIGYTGPTRRLLEGTANLHRPPTNCESTIKGLEKLDDWLGEGKWDVVHFNWGLHDLKYVDEDGKIVQNPADGKQLLTVEQYAKNLDKLVKRLKQTGATLIWRTTTPIPEGSKGRVSGDSVRYNVAAAKVIAKHKEVLVHDLYAYVKEHEDELAKPSNVHYSRAGSKRLAKEVVEAIRAALEQGKQPGEALSGSRPNIIFIFTDDHAPHAISAYGSKINETPNIDRLASEGMLFRRSYCTNSICGPSRATILTGLHSHANGFMQNTAGGFDGSQQTFPKLLQKAGYQTAIFGKWHLKTQPTGFDKWMILPGQGAYYNPGFITPDGRIRIEGYCTDVTTDLTLQWLDEQRDPDKPFMLMCQHKAPHRTWMPGPNELSLYRDADIPEPATLFDDYAGRGPALPKNRMEIDRHMRMAYDLQVVGPPVEGQDVRERKGSGPAGLRRLTPEQLAAWDAAYAEDNAAFLKAQPTMSKEGIVRWKYQRYIKNYLRCVAGVDRNVGRVLDYLDENPELAKNTIVIYSSDQGFYLGDHGWFDKRWMYEESFAMPLIVRWPGHIPVGIENTELVQNIDYAPTFLDLAGTKPEKPMHGTSLVPLLEGDAELPGRDALYYHYYESPSEHRVTAHYGVATNRYKLIRHYGPEVYWELFDLQEDPDELTSVYGQEAYAEIQAELHKRLIELRQEFDNDIGSE